jgi:hypothetical protein
MTKKVMITAAALGFAALTFGVSTAALAQPPYWAPAHGWRAHAHAPAPRYYYAPRPVYLVPAPRVYYTPPPVAYYPAPVYAPVPVVPAAPAPAYPTGGVSIRLHFPL